MWGQIGIQKILEKTSEELEVVLLALDVVHSDLDSTYQYNYLLAESRQVLEDWVKYYNSHKEVVFTDLVNLKEENENLKVTSKVMMKEVERLNEEIEKLRNENLNIRVVSNNIEQVIEFKDKSMNEMANTLDSRMFDVADKLSEVLKHLEENAEYYAKLKGMQLRKKDETGSESNRFIKELDTEKLIKIYKENGYSIPKDVYEYYNRQYGITYNGLRARLITAGVWKPRK